MVQHVGPRDDRADEERPYGPTDERSAGPKEVLQGQ